jgi:hypothetical protein
VIKETVPPPLQPSIENNVDPHMLMIETFLSNILASPNVMKNLSFKDGVGSSTVGNLLQQKAAEIEKKKARDKMHYARKQMKVLMNNNCVLVICFNVK